MRARSKTIQMQRRAVGESVTSKRAAQRKRKLQTDLQTLYAEVMDGEAVLHWRLPGWQSAERMIEAGLAAITKVAMQDGDVEIAMKAGMYLVEYGMRVMERGGKQIEGAGVMAQLEQLYRKALPVEAEALVVEEPGS